MNACRNAYHTTKSSRLRHSRNAKPAFTLIELLVVIAIIAILAAILFPVFAQAREKARQTTCLSNEKQIGVAILQYNQDADEQNPLAFQLGATTSATVTPLSWAGAVLPYVKSTGVFICPSEGSMVGITPGTFTASTPGGFPVEYAYNYYIGGTGKAGDSARANQGLAVIQNPAQTVLLTESGANPAVTTSPDTWTTSHSTSGAAAPNDTVTTKERTSWLLVMSGSSLVTPTKNADYGGPVARHQLRTNVLWADGHAKSAKIASFYVLFGSSAPFIPTDPNDPYLYTPGWSPCLDPFYGCL